MRFLLALLKFFSFFAADTRVENDLKNVADIPARFTGYDRGAWELKKTSQGDYSYFEIAGPSPDAPVLVMIHGLSLDGRTFAHLSSLSAYFRLLAINLPETSPLYTGRLSDFCTILSQWLAEAGVDRFHLAGCSFGGIIAQHIAAGCLKDRIQSVTLLASYIPGYNKSDIRNLSFRAETFRTLSDTRMFWMMELLRKRALRSVSRSGKYDIKNIIFQRPPYYARQVLESMYRYSGIDAAKAIDIPVLQVHGSKDQALPKKKARETLKYFKHIKYCEIPGGGHSFVYEDAKELIPLMLRFYSSNAIIKPNEVQ